MSTKKILRKIVKNGVEMHLPQNNVFVITEDKLTKTTTATKWVAPYNTDYYYTNYQISATAWVKWIEWALYTFMISTKTTDSAYRNVRVQIWTGSYIPVMSSSWTILWWSSYFTKANDRIYQYSTRYESWGALHLITDSNTTYSSMSADEWKTGTATSARSLTAANLKAIIEYHAGNLHDSTKADKNNVLELDNTDSYTPSANYHPATKKYVDDAVSQAWGGAIVDFVNWSALATNTKSLTSSWTESVTLNNKTSLIVINWYIDGFSWMNNFGQWIFMMLTKNNTIWYIRLWNWNVITLTANFTNHSLSIAKTITWTVWNWSITIKEF